MNQTPPPFASGALDLGGQLVAYLRTAPEAKAPTTSSRLDRPVAPPVLVFLHGWAAGKAIWIGLMRRLGGTYPTLALDLPGHGDSDPAPGSFSPDSMATVVQDVLGALEVRDCVVIGHSMGTLVALALALRQPPGASEDRPALPTAAEDVESGESNESARAMGPTPSEVSRATHAPTIRGIVLCNPPYVADMRRHLGPWQSDRLLRVLLSLGRRTYRTLGWRASMDATGRLAAFRRRAAAYGAVPTEVLLRTARMLETVDLAPQLAGVPVPTLVTLGRYDLLTPARGGRKVAAGIPGSTRIELATGHEAMDSHEALLAETIGGWLAERGW
jgi:pimeloyl-ACP methyl ester carboxylesterase